jgi:hypothetical protein
MSVLGAPSRKMTSTFAQCRKALLYSNLETEDLLMKKSLSYLATKGLLLGMVDGSPLNSESAASVISAFVYATPSKGLLTNQYQSFFKIIVS